MQVKDDNKACPQKDHDEHFVLMVELKIKNKNHNFTPS